MKQMSYIDELESELAEQLETLNFLMKEREKATDFQSSALIEFQIDKTLKRIQRLRTKIKEYRKSSGKILKHIGFHLYLGKEEKQMLNELAIHYGLRRSELVRVLIKKLYKETFEKEGRQETNRIAVV